LTGDLTVQATRKSDIVLELKIYQSDRPSYNLLLNCFRYINLTLLVEKTKNCPLVRSGESIPPVKVVTNITSQQQKVTKKAEKNSESSTSTQQGKGALEEGRSHTTN